ncbi:Exo_endo_phos domain-containing protein [Gossypium australe]|uniref:Exo_endo_phos domain-containing protein n=1 Tax=Gossypium australe TaxID=47621 RepID=A0A5B6VUD0_9ROSI|nr:Exo_endo_phos domain-containing protein [Gossypium australe]
MGFYGAPIVIERTLTHPWLVCGNFNEIVYSFEKNGGVPRGEKRMEAFQTVFDECRLLDVGFFGLWFTWESGNLPETNIGEMLDRGAANTEWFSIFPHARIQHPIQIRIIVLCSFIQSRGIGR